MENNKHTPKPWTQYPLYNQDKEVVIMATVNGLDFEIATVGRNTKANACLIASAPDLLEALKKIYDACPDYEKIQGLLGMIKRTAETAINKAEGKA